MAWAGRPAARARAWLALHLPMACPYCGQLVEVGQAWDVDHATPRVRGGSDTPGNLRPAHASCNRAAGADLARSRRAQLRTWPP